MNFFIESNDLVYCYNEPLPSCNKIMDNKSRSVLNRVVDANNLLIFAINCSI